MTNSMTGYTRMRRQQMNKKISDYNAGIEYALRIARKGGIEALEREVKYRGAHNSVRGVDARELTAVARTMCSKELNVSKKQLRAFVEENHIVKPVKD